MVFWLLLIFILVLALIALLALAVGVLLGGFLGGVVGGVRGGVKAPEGQEELATYRGVTWGGCLGALTGLLLTGLLLVLAWTYWL
jgi:hypothetical protein